MSSKILKGSVGLLSGVVLVAAGARVGAAGQNPTPPPQPPPASQQTQSAQPPPQAAAAAGAATPAVPANKDPQALAGIWKVNKDLSSDTTKLQQQADNTPQSGTAQQNSGHHNPFGFGRGGGGQKTPSTASTEQALARRALLREMAQTPQQVTMVVTADTTTFTDEQGVVRKFTTDGKKETVDLGAAQVDSVAKWEDGVLTVELTGGTLKLTEVYQLTLQRHDMVVALTAVDSDKRQNVGAAAVPIKRIYERPDTAGK